MAGVTSQAKSCWAKHQHNTLSGKRSRITADTQMGEG